jgi:hypothetical protein
MGKKDTIKKAAAEVAEDVVGSTNTKMDKLRKVAKRSKAKSNKSKKNTKTPPRNDAVEASIKAEFYTRREVKQADLYYRVSEFEQDIYRIEGFKVIVRASSIAKIRRYPYKKRCSSNNTVKYFIEHRLKRTTDSEFEFEIPYYTDYETLSDLRVLEGINRASNALSHTEEE